MKISKREFIKKVGFLGAAGILATVRITGAARSSVSNANDFVGFDDGKSPEAPSDEEINRVFGKHDEDAFRSPPKVYRPEAAQWAWQKT